MSISGSFYVTSDPQQDEAARPERMRVNKCYSGAMIGACVEKAIRKKSKKGISVRFLIEKFNRSISGKAGRFPLMHSGFMSGALYIQQAKNQHSYLTYQF